MAKRCTGCLEWKDSTSFYKDRSKLDGLKSQCKDCRKLYKREYRARLRSRRNARFRRFYVRAARSAKATPRARPDMTAGFARWRSRSRARQQAYISAHLRQWHITNREASQVWHRHHPSDAVARRHIQRARGTSAVINTLNPEEWIWLQSAYGHQCAYCGDHASQLTPDHVIPLSRGGNNSLSNIVPACLSCNTRKGARTPEQSDMTFAVRVDISRQLEQLAFI